MNLSVTGMLIWSLGAAFGGPPDSQLVESALTQWESHGDTGEYEAVVDWAKIAREGTAKGNSQVLARLVAIAESESQRMGSRGAALSVAAGVADEAGGLAVLAVVDDLLTAQLTQSDVENETQRPRLAYTRGLMVRGFVQNDMEHLIETMDDDTAALAFLRDRYAFPVVGMEQHVAELIASCNVPADVRCDAAIRIISARKYGERWPVVEMLDPAGFPPLRELVRAHSSVREFHFAAAGALAYHGDQEILPYLESLRPSFLAEHRNHERRLLSLIWRIEVQHPPAKLLEYIASPDYMRTRDPRSWAVRRAKPLGIEPDQIREAILTHER